MDYKEINNDNRAEHLLRIQRDLGIALSSTENLPDVLNLVLDALFRTDAIEGGCIYIFSSNLQSIALESTRGFSPQYIESARKNIFNEDIFTYIQSGTPFYSMFEKIASPYGILGVTDGFRSFGIIPFVYEGKVLGAISVASKSTEHIQPESRFFFETIAARMAGIINRLRSEDALKKINTTLEDLYCKLKISEERYRSVVEDLTDIISRFLPDGTITFVNNAYCSYFGLAKEEFIGKNYLHGALDEDRDRIVRHIFSLSKDKPVGNIEYRIILPDGKTRWIDWTDRAIFNDNGIIVEYQSVGRDITEKKAMREKLEYVGMHDALTGLYNRAYFDEEIKRLSSSRFLPLGLVVCDLNGLKIVNDALGHQKGDTILLAASLVLKQSFRDTDIIARIGGDEFAVILPNTAEQSILNSIDRIKKTIKETRENNPDTPLSLAVGYAVRTSISVTMESSFSEADDRMYREKEIQRDFSRGLVLTTMMHELSRSDEYRAKHMLRVRDISLSIGRKLALDERELEKLQLASRYHDIGMVGINLTMLNKNEPLTADEIDAMQRHPEIGSRIAEAHPLLRDISDIILKHHEWWNGQGYPKGIKGEEIPLLSRIIILAEAFDAMTNNKYFREPISRQEAFSIIRDHTGTQFDPGVVSAFFLIF